MGQDIGRIEILPNPLALAHHVAEWMTQAALAAPGLFRVSLSGGSTPKTLYGLLASDEFRSRFPWSRVSWYWGDERFVPHDHPDSNYRMTREAMLIRLRCRLKTSIRFRQTALRRTRPGVTSKHCKMPTALQRLIRNARFSTSRCSGLVPTGTPHPCYLGSQC
jgi:6-phosphogluconolactonase/glucosamine-6-phosphate isomerase/deaminase